MLWWKAVYSAATLLSYASSDFGSQSNTATGNTTIISWFSLLKYKYIIRTARVCIKMLPVTLIIVVHFFCTFIKIVLCVQYSNCINSSAIMIFLLLYLWSQYYAFTSKKTSKIYQTWCLWTGSFGKLGSKFKNQKSRLAQPEVNSFFLSLFLNKKIGYFTLSR